MEVIVSLFIKPVLVFCLGFAAIYLFGRKSVAAMDNFELLLVMIAAGLFSASLISFRMSAAVLAPLVLAGLYLLFQYLLLKPAAKEWLGSQPTVLIKDGAVDYQALKKIRMPVEDLLSQIRLKGFSDPKDLALAAYENNGMISVIPNSRIRPLQPGDMQMDPQPPFIPIPLIVDGEIVEINLRFLNKDKIWLNQQLMANGRNLDDLADIALALYNQDGTVQIHWKNQTPGLTSGPYGYKPGIEKG